MMTFITDATLGSNLNEGGKKVVSGEWSVVSAVIE